MIDQIVARKMAEQFLTRQDLKGYKYAFSAVTFNGGRPGEWGVVFDVYSAQNTLIDGPVVIVVDKTNGATQFL